jgi:transforming growth factor-beta-induced protein
MMKKFMHSLATLKVVAMTALLASFVLVGCNNDDDPDPDMMADQSIVQLAQGNSDLSTLVTILTSPGFEDLLAAAGSASSDLTVFAPSNQAFANLLSALGKSSLDEVPSGILKEIVSYHIVGQSVLSTELTEGSVPTLLANESVEVSLSGGVKINSANVIAADVEASNGVVHVVDAVLLPSFVTRALGTVVEVPLFSNDFTILVGAVRKAGLFDALIDSDALTVFAPTNAAFEAAGITNLDDFTADQLAEVLLYHVVGSIVKSTDLPGVENGVVQTLKTEGFGKFYLSLGSNVYINGSSMVTAVDIEKQNGVIHVIDEVLLPPSQTVVEIAAALAGAAEPQFTALVGILTDASQADILAALSDAQGNFTVFAPTDEAFAAIADVTATLTPAQISQVLLYHVVPGRVFSTDLSDGLEPTTLKDETIVFNVGESGVSINDKAGNTVNVVATDVLGTNGVIHVIDKVLIPTL